MRIFTLICSLLLLALGAAGFYGWGVEGDGPRTLVSAIPAGFGALMLFGLLLSLVLRGTGMQIALLAALGGGFSGLGRLTPSYLKGALDWKSYPLNLIVAMAVICLVYLLAMIVFVFVPKRPRPVGSKPDTSETPEEETESVPC